MSERNLDMVIRQLREAGVYLKFAKEAASNLLDNYNVANDIHLLEMNLADEIRVLNTEYRESHFEHRR